MGLRGPETLPRGHPRLGHLRPPQAVGIGSGGMMQFKRVLVDSGLSSMTQQAGARRFPCNRGSASTQARMHARARTGIYARTHVRRDASAHNARTDYDS